MKTVNDSAPTSFDHSLGAFRAFADKGDWLVAPCGQTRDSGLLTRINFKAMIASLDSIDPEGNDHETHRIGHWGPGWYDIVIIRPHTRACWDATEIEAALENYPVLDDHAYSTALHSAVESEWSSMRIRDRLALMKRARSEVSILQARYDSPPDCERVREALERSAES